MSLVPAIWARPASHIRAECPRRPVLYFSPSTLQTTYRRFRDGFPGLVTFAVKANDTPIVIENLVAAGMRAFDVASPFEMHLVRGILPSATLHYNNPVRDRFEISEAVELGVASYSVDALSELEKLAEGGVPAGTEISARLKLPIEGATYDFGEKFGTDPETCIELLNRIVTLGFVPSMTFHPGTQCKCPEAWRNYIDACGRISRAAGIHLSRLNVGGGFAAHRTGNAPDLEQVFQTIVTAVDRAFGPNAPDLICEPGRAMVADAMTLGCRIKAIRDDGAVFLNDGIYGGLSEMPVMGMTDRMEVLSPDGQIRRGAPQEHTVFGPTCDSLDRLPGTLALPADTEEGDFLLFHGLGAYSTATRTFFNGYGHIDVTTVDRAT